MELVAKTTFGLEDVLADELFQIGATKIRKQKRAVVFEGNKALCYAANLHLRTALRILQPIAHFQVYSEKDLYKRIKRMPWPEIFNLDQTFAIDAVVGGTKFRHSQFAALKAKDAIVDRFREETGERPNVDIKEPDYRINVRISSDQCAIALDSSGESLHKRGYREATGAAPLSEVLAAGMILLSGWDRKSKLVDGMCGSGTIPIEAAMIATNTPPQLNRKSFGFQKWNDFDEGLWRQLLVDAKLQVTEPKLQIIASDRSHRMIELAKSNVKNAGMERYIQCQVKYFDSLKPGSDHGTLIINPPYGERMKPDEINSLYQTIGDTLKQNFTGFDAWILSSNKEALKHVGLRTSKKLTLFNGPLECKYHKYEMYKGTKKSRPDTES